jgi:hypothetical protein
MIKAIVYHKIEEKEAPEKGVNDDYSEKETFGCFKSFDEHFFSSGK